jgi:hypothetical protein
MTRESEYGKCRVCGCSDLNPCVSRGGAGSPVDTCSWLDFDHTLCSNLRCVALTPLEVMLEEMTMFKRRAA